MAVELNASLEVARCDMSHPKRYVATNSSINRADLPFLDSESAHLVNSDTILFRRGSAFSKEATTIW